MTFEQENEFIEKYYDKCVKIVTKDLVVFGRISFLESYCDTDDGKTCISVSYLDKDICEAVDGDEIEKIELVNESICKKYNFPINIKDLKLYL